MLFGSLAKGTSKKSSDIDAKVFVDVDMLAERLRLRISELLERVEVELIDPNGVISLHFLKRYRNLYRNMILRSLRRKLSWRDLRP